MFLAGIDGQPRRVDNILHALDVSPGADIAIHLEDLDAFATAIPIAWCNSLHRRTSP